MAPILAFLGSIGTSVGVGATVVGTTAVTATTASVVAGGVIAAGAVAGAGAYSSNAKRRAASQQRVASEQIQQTRQKAQAEISKLEKQQATELGIIKSDAAAATEKSKTEEGVRLAAKERQRKKVASVRGRKSTILTSPLGIPGQGDREKKKTLIGT